MMLEMVLLIIKMYCQESMKSYLLFKSKMKKYLNLSYLFVYKYYNMSTASHANIHPRSRFLSSIHTCVTLLTNVDMRMKR